MADVTMPRLSDTMQEGTIASWLKQPGEQIKKGDVIAQIETDKATMDLTAFEAGTLQEILAPEGSTVAIGQPVARIGSGAARASAAPARSSPPQGDDTQAVAANPPPGAASSGSETPQTPAARENVGEAPEPTAPPHEQPTLAAQTEPAQSQQKLPASQNGAAPTAAEGKTRASPMARHIAAEHGLDLTAIQGSGPQGRVIRSDVEAALSSAPPAPPTPAPDDGASHPQPAAASAQDDERVPLSQMRRTIARRMAESTRTVPHFFLTTTIDATAMVQLRKQIVDSGTKVTFNDLIVKGAALALRQVPDVNVSFAEDSLIKHRRVHIGVAVATERGLIVPVLRDVDQKTVSQIARETRDLAERANSGKLQPAEYSGGTFTISNLGMFGVEQFNAVINPPESAILAVGAIVREPAAVEERIELRHHLKLTLSVDHRALDGSVGARYLQALKQLLENPMLLLV
ncbi:MAG TPA: dihydrolipoamide acetyltransferase family protein [Chloroflexota bacterium]|jgi:pyruvate dehydrogenase E2 component (dihydrolipoamide acetyltransferase)|nr:dihydrolipoamide acetyltransferase family protein [Chloroflexota bacterium]